MKHHNPAMYLYEFVGAAQQVLEFTASLSYQDYLGDRLVRAATEANVVRIGHLLGRLAETSPETAATLGEIADVIAQGEHVLHEYDNVDHPAVWSVIQSQLPALLAQAQVLLISADKGAPEGDPQAVAVIPLIEAQREALGDLCRRHHVRRLEVFGSAARGDFDPEHSDLDFLVEFLAGEEGEGFGSYFDLRFSLEELFGRKVDLVTASSVRNPYFVTDIAQSRTTLYTA
jgi:uncharacterized protein